MPRYQRWQICKLVGFFLILQTWDKNLAAYNKVSVGFCLTPASPLPMDWLNKLKARSGCGTGQLLANQPSYSSSNWSTRNQKCQSLRRAWIFQLSESPTLLHKGLLFYVSCACMCFLTPEKRFSPTADADWSCLRCFEISPLLPLELFPALFFLTDRENKLDRDP